tara:strand:+ start:29 stop:487 length:459 start_codon:yes stop_codon:yes gene_type:complete
MRRGNGEEKLTTGRKETGFDRLHTLDGARNDELSNGFSQAENPLNGFRISEFENREVTKTMEDCTDGFCPMPTAASVDNNLHFFDPVEKPIHYAASSVECIDAIEAQLTPEEFRGYLKGNVAKYMWRERQKGGIESLKKAKWYLSKLIGLNS